MSFLLFLILIIGVVLLVIWTRRASLPKKSQTHRPVLDQPLHPNKSELKPALQSDARFTLIPSSFDPDGSGPMDGHGYTVFHQRKQMMIPWQSLNYLDGLESFKVAGTSHRLPALQSAECEPGQLLTLVCEPNNPHDRNAVGVWDLRRTQQIGYLPREVAKEYSQRLSKGEPIRCLSIWEYLKDGQRVGLRVLLILKNASIQLPPSS